MRTISESELVYIFCYHTPTADDSKKWREAIHFIIGALQFSHLYIRLKAGFRRGKKIIAAGISGYIHSNVLNKNPCSVIEMRLMTSFVWIKPQKNSSIREDFRIVP
jgi:hypothetical protein